MKIHEEIFDSAPEGDWALEQLEQAQAAEAAAGSWSDEAREDPSREIEESRHAWENRQRRTALKPNS